MKEINNYQHKFKIDNEEIILSISYINGLWTSKVLSGNASVGNISGGSHESLDEYIKFLEREHIYAYNFFNHGYKYAKSKSRL